MFALTNSDSGLNKCTCCFFQVTAGDLNTDDSFIESVIQKDVGLPTCQATLGRKFAEATQRPDFSHQLAGLIAAPASEYFPFIEAAVGYGLAATIEEAVKVTTAGGNFFNALRKPRVAIQGFGAVGSSLAYYLHQKNIATVVCIADKDGYVHTSAPEGLDIVYFLEERKKRTASLPRESSEFAVFSKNLLCNLPEDLRQAGSRPMTRVLWSTLKAGEREFIEMATVEEIDVLCPCALRYVVTENVVNAVFAKPNGPRYLVSGANNPYGIVDAGGNVSEDKQHIISTMLCGYNICTVPDWVANSGTAQLFHVGLTQKFASGSQPEAILEACAAPIRAFIQSAYKTYTQSKPVLMNYATYRHAASLLDNPQPFGCPARCLSQSPYALLPLEKMVSAEERFRLLKALQGELGESCEVIDEKELLQLLQTKMNPVAYDGFEPSGRMHIAQGLMKAAIVNTFTAAGFTFILWVADWFAKLNHKMGGDLEKIKTTGQYMIEVWKACGMNTSRVRFLWASDEFSSRGDDYWSGVLANATAITLKRTLRCTQIMGRADTDDLSASQIFYPIMQCTDIEFLGVDVCQLGGDQRKVNMLARERASQQGRPAPVVYSHPMIPGLLQGQEKMSKSKPDTAIFMEDSKEEVNRKIRAAYCPPGEVNSKDNPCLQFFRFVVFPSYRQRGQKVQIVDWDNNDTTAVFESFQQLEAVYASGSIHPKVLKANLACLLNELLEPVRQHFEKDPRARELKAKVQSYMAL